MNTLYTRLPWSFCCWFVCLVLNETSVLVEYVISGVVMSLNVIFAFGLVVVSLVVVVVISVLLLIPHVRWSLFPVDSLSTVNQKYMNSFIIKLFISHSKTTIRIKIDLNMLHLYSDINYILLCLPNDAIYGDELCYRAT